jgi:hypothetical protein
MRKCGLEFRCFSLKLPRYFEIIFRSYDRSNSINKTVSLTVQHRHTHDNNYVVFTQAGCLPDSPPDRPLIRPLSVVVSVKLSVEQSEGVEGHNDRQLRKPWACSGDHVTLTSADNSERKMAKNMTLFAAAAAVRYNTKKCRRLYDKRGVIIMGLEREAETQILLPKLCRKSKHLPNISSL